MSPQTTAPADPEDGRGTATRTLRLRRLISPLVALSGVLLLVGAARAATDDRRRAGVLALSGGGLLVAWLGRRGSPTANDPEAPDAGEGETTGRQAVSAEASAHREQSEVLDRAEENPRGVSGEPDVETQTAPDEGDVQFTTDQNEDSGPKPHVDGDADPRVPGDAAADDDHVEVNLSEPSMADEASEATGPAPEQSYPSLEGTDPEPTAAEAPERDGEGAAANPGPIFEDGDSDEETASDEEVASDKEAASDEEVASGEETASDRETVSDEQAASDEGERTGK